MPPSRSTPAAVIEKTVRDFVAGRASLSQLYSDDELKRIQMVRHGLPARAIDTMSTDLGLPKELVYTLLGVSRVTASRQAKTDKKLDTAATERAVFVAGLVKVVADMVPEGASAAEDFSPAKWVAQWLVEPQPALGGKTPSSFMDTADGRVIVERLLWQMETGTYA